MVVTQLTSQLDRSELKEEAPLNTARGEMGESEGTSTRQARGEAGRRRALLSMSVTKLTSQLDMSELKEEADSNTARAETGEIEGKAGGLAGGTHLCTCW